MRAPRNERARRRRAERAGRVAERLVALGYRLAGWRLLDRRARTPYGELDLVLARAEQVLFVEVKQRGAASAAFAAGEVVSARQRRRLMRAAQSYLARARLDGAAVRFDVVIWQAGRLPRRLKNVIWEE